MSQSISRDAIVGLTGIFAARIPMTEVMFSMHQLLLKNERYPLAPALVIGELLRLAGRENRQVQSGSFSLPLAFHLAFGAAAGALYVLVTKEIRVHSEIKGAGYEFLIWSGTYLGLLPAFCMLTSTTKHPSRRNALMMTATMIWGATVGLLKDFLSPCQHPDLILAP